MEKKKMKMRQDGKREELNISPWQLSLEERRRLTGSVG